MAASQHFLCLFALICFLCASVSVSLSPTTTNNQPTNHQPPLPTNQVCVAVACGGDHTIVARADRCVLSVGRNHRGQLGLGQLSASELRALGIPKDPKVQRCAICYIMAREKR